VRNVMAIYRFAWLLWLGGTIVILLSWVDAVSPTVGWAGFAVTLAGCALSWIASQPPYPVSPEQKPVSPSGVSIGTDTALEKGAAVLAYSQGYWWRARVVALEENSFVRIEFPGWDPSMQMRVPQDQLQVDVQASRDAMNADKAALRRVSEMKAEPSNPADSR
jgi:hypothetical protein